MPGGVQIEKGANVVARQKHTYLWLSVSVVFWLNRIVLAGLIAPGDQ
jgi:hypothetical protein